MIAQIIPYTRTIRGKEFFDYAIPEGMVVTPGMVVIIPFRSLKIFGLVWNVGKTSVHIKLRPIISVVTNDLWGNSERQHFLQWFAAYYAISLPHAWKTMQYPLLKKPKPIAHSIFALHKEHSTTTVRIPYSQVQHIQEAIKTIASSRINLVHYSHRDDCLAFYLSYVQRSQGTTLIIIPEYHTMKALASALQHIPICIVPDNASPSFWHALVETLHHNSNAPRIVLATKKAMFLPMQYFQTVILDQEHSAFHKQVDLNPRYHVRDLFYKLAGQKQKQMATPWPIFILTSHAPSMEAEYHKQQHHDVSIDIRRPASSARVMVVNMEDEKRNKNYSWFSEALLHRISTSQHALLFLNRTGRFSVAICNDCSTILPLETTVCSHCHGAHIRFASKGTERLEEELHELFPQKKIFRIDRHQDEKQLATDEWKDAEIIVGTEKIFRFVPLHFFDLIGILSIDHLLVYPHFQAHERVFQLLTMLFFSGRPVIIQTHAPEHPLISAAVTNSYDTYAKNELEIRTVLKLPPIYPAIQLIDTKTKKRVRLQGTLDVSTLSPTTVVDRL
ncbi:MAG: hypothetical protein HYV32_04275 [Candidatus Kerfeldbacteria bacterium]|nr:hypothetical protein [Candidatus Kerfeldbacteria bacterium]